MAVNTTIGAASGCIATLFIAMAYQYFTLGVVVWDLIIAGEWQHCIAVGRGCGTQ